MRIGILGAGAWGTTLGIILARKGHSVSLWEFRPELAQRMARARENELYLAGVAFPATVTITSELAPVVRGSDLVVFVVPSQVMREVARAARPHLDGRRLLVSASKGIERDTLARMTEVIGSEIPGASDDVVALVGPSIAREVVEGIPTAIVAASRSPTRARETQEIFTTDRFRVYTNDDVVGVELGVALKNIIAIAAGLSDGLGYGTNTKAALVTRGLAEITRLGVRMGANPLTFAGLAGIGDLVTTCMSPMSRNRRVGEAVARGRRLDDVLAEMVEVAEGVETTRVALALAARVGVELPIAAQVSQVLFDGKSPEIAVAELMARDLKGETVSPAPAPAPGAGRSSHG